MVDPSDSQFMTQVVSLAQALGANAHTDSQIESFFRLCEGRKRLPKGSSQNITEAFLASVITVLSLKQNVAHSLKAIKHLHTFLRYDSSVFSTFKPSKPLLRKMNLSEHVMSSSIAEVEQALDLAAFLLRYHRSIDYGDFSDNAYVVQRIRRYVDYKYWAEIEELGNNHTGLETHFNSFRSSTETQLRDLQANLDQLRSQKDDGISRDQYRKLLELMLELEKKFDTKHLSVLASVRKDFTSLINEASDKHNLNIAANHSRLLELMQLIERKTDARSQGLIDDLRTELERIIRTKEFSDGNYQRAFGLIGQIGEHIDLRNQDIGNNFSSLKLEMESFVNERNRHMEGLHQKNHQRVLQLMVDLERKAEEKINDNASELRRELARIAESTKAVFEDSQQQNYKRLLEIMTDLEKRLEQKSGSILDELRREISSVVDSALAKSGGRSDQNYKKTLELMLELEHKLELRQNDLTAELRNDFARMLEQVGDNKRLKHELEELLGRRIRTVEQKMLEQDKHLKTMFGDLMKDAEAALARGVDLKIKDAQSAIGRMIDSKLNDTASTIGRAIDTKMADTHQTLKNLIERLMAEQQNGLQKLIDQRILDSSGAIERLIDNKVSASEQGVKLVIDQKLQQQLSGLGRTIDQKVNEAANSLLQRFESKIEDSQETMTRLVETKLQQLNDVVGRLVDKKIDERTHKLTRLMDEKLEGQKEMIRQMVDHRVDETKQMLEADIRSAIQQAQATVVKQMDQKMRDTFDALKRLVDEELKNTEAQVNRLIDLKLQDSQNFIGRIVDTKLAATKDELENQIRQRLDDAALRIQRDVESRLRSALEDYDIKAEERIAEIYRKLQERMANLMEENDRNIGKMIRDQLTDIHKQMSTNLESLRVAMEKFATEKILYTEGEIYKNIDRRLEMFEGRMVKLETTFSTFMENKLKDMDRRLREEISLAMKDLRSELNQIIDERARQAVNSMIQIVEQRVNSMEKKLQIFDEEMQRMIDIKVETSQRILEKFCEELVSNVERLIDIKYLPRIEELERQMRSTQDSLASFFQKNELDLAKLTRIEEAIREQIDLIHALNEKCAVIAEESRVGDEDLDQRINALANGLNGLGRGGKGTDIQGITDNVEDLRSRMRILFENDGNQQREINLLKERTNDELEAKINLIMRNRDDLLARIELCEAETARMNAETRNEQEQQGHRFNQAIGLLDSKQQKLIGIVEKLEEDVRIQVDRAIRDLESTDLRQQKEIADLNDQYKEFLKNYEAFREMITRELKEEFTKINENFEAQARIIATKEARLRAEIEALRKELQPLFDLIDEIKIIIARLDALESGLGNIRVDITELNKSQELLRSIPKDEVDLEPIKKRLSTIETALGEIDRLGRLIEEANKLWVFFQKFIDEQAMDHVKYIRSGDCTLTEKLFSMEWFARYCEFITPDTLIMAVNSFKEIYSGTDVQMSKDFMEHYHHQEGIPTCLQSLRNLHVKIGKELMDIETYDQNNAMLLMVLEPLLINDLNHDMALKLNGMVDMSRLMMEQPVPSEVSNFEYTKKFVNTSFKYSLRCIAASVRNERGVLEFMANPKWLSRLLQILEEWKEEEQIANACKALRLILRNESTYDKIASSYPNMGNFLLILLNEYSNSAAIVVEAANCFRNITRKASYLGNIRPDNLTTLFNLLKNPKHGPTHDKIGETLRFLQKDARLKAVIDKNGGAPTNSIPN